MKTNEKKGLDPAMNQDTVFLNSGISIIDLLNHQKKEFGAYPSNIEINLLHEFFEEYFHLWSPNVNLDSTLVRLMLEFARYAEDSPLYQYRHS